MAQTIPGNTTSNSESEYSHLVSYFKYLVTITGGVLAVAIGAASFLFYSNLRDARQDAKQAATDIATAQAKASVTQAFDEKNINAMILLAAEQKVGTVTDKLIEQQVTTKLQPIEHRILLFGQISESESRMRLGFRSGLDDLNRIMSDTNDPDVLRFGKNTLATVANDFDLGGQKQLKSTNLKAIDLYEAYIRKPNQPTLHDVVQTIDSDQDLNNVGYGFQAFRELTGESVKMFDFGAVRSWCSQNQPKC